jgi:hypothetical protein
MHDAVWFFVVIAKLGTRKVRKGGGGVILLDNKGNTEGGGGIKK